VYILIIMRPGRGESGKSTGEEKVTWLKRKHLRNHRKRGEEAGLVA
jgi:hypothetical protein